MVVTLALPDELYAKYAGYGSDPRKAMVAQLTRFQDVSPTDRVILLHGDDRRALEAVLQRKLESVDELIKLVTRMASVSVGDVTLTLSPTQLKRLEGEAKFFKQELPGYVSKRLGEAVRSITGGA